jgi:hypothetical protein
VYEITVYGGCNAELLKHGVISPSVYSISLVFLGELKKLVFYIDLFFPSLNAVTFPILSQPFQKTL